MHDSIFPSYLLAAKYAEVALRSEFASCNLAYKFVTIAQLAMSISKMKVNYRHITHGDVPWSKQAYTKCCVAHLDVSLESPTEAYLQPSL